MAMRRTIYLHEVIDKKSGRKRYSINLPEKLMKELGWKDKNPLKIEKTLKSHKTCEIYGKNLKEYAL